jgi:hypothetical protein
MNHKISDNEILEKVVQKLNEKNYSKQSISNISKNEIKIILTEIYKEYHSLGGLDKSQKEPWKMACQEILQEFSNNNKEDTKTQQKDENHRSTDKEDYKKDQSKREDYDDDLIQLEFPQVYSEQIHGPKIEKLSEQLEKQRKEERQIKEDCEKNIGEEIKKYKEKQEKNQQFNGDDKKKLEKAIKDLKREKKQKIKDNPYMKNNEFLMLLCLMRLKKETLYESNPYIVDFSVTLDSVYQSKKDDETDDSSNLFSKFESDLNKYVD